MGPSPLFCRSLVVAILPRTERRVPSENLNQRPAREGGQPAATSTMTRGSSREGARHPTAEGGGERGGGEERAPPFLNAEPSCSELASLSLRGKSSHPLCNFGTFRAKPENEAKPVMCRGKTIESHRPRRSRQSRPKTEPRWSTARGQISGQLFAEVGQMVFHASVCRPLEVLVPQQAAHRRLPSSRQELAHLSGLPIYAWQLCRA